MRSSGRVVAMVVGLAMCAAASAHSQAKWSNAEIYEENDTLVPSAVSSDSLYTQGLRIVFMRARNAQWGFVGKVRNAWSPFFFGHDYRAAGGVVFGQSMFTPVVITTFFPDPHDRPFAALLYAGTRVDLVRLDGDSRHSFELTGGFMGPPALAKDAQSGLHVLREHRIPKGWYHQVDTELAANLRYAYHHRLGWHFLDLTPGFTLNAGTIQFYPAGEATVRAGWRMTGMPLAASPYSAREDTESEREQRNYEFGILAGVEARRMFHTAYLDGGLVTGGPSVPRERAVYDVRYGLFARYKVWRATYSLVRRSREFLGEAGGKHHFGSLAISREVLPGTPPASGPQHCALSNWLVELGMGRGKGRFEPEIPGFVRSGPAARAGIARGLTCQPLGEQMRLKQRVAIGLERVGVVREGGPPDASGAHRDDFLLTDAFTLRVRPFAPRNNKPGRLHLRLGAGRASAKRERTRAGLAFEETVESGFGVVAGADYMFRLANGPLSLGFDVTASKAWIDKQLYDRGRFLTGALVLLWHP
jgi:lipid A 3-O-deacylase